MQVQQQKSFNYLTCKQAGDVTVHQEIKKSIETGKEMTQISQLADKACKITVIYTFTCKWVKR
jgi:hypothetical protein